MTDISPAAPAAKTYTEDDVAALMKEKLAAEAKAASLIDKVAAATASVNEAIAANEAIRGELKKSRAQVELLQKELQLMKSKYINKQTDW